MMRKRLINCGCKNKHISNIKDFYGHILIVGIPIILGAKTVKRTGLKMTNKLKTPPLDFVWTPAGTDITERWRTHHGWIPPSELPEYQRKWTIYQELPLRKLTDEAKKEIEQLLTVNKVKRWKVK